MFVLTLLACLTAIASAAPSQSLGESKLVQALISTNQLQQSDPSRSLACFQYYSQVFDQLLQQYEKEFETCQNNTQQQTATLDWLYSTKTSILANEVQTACQLVEACDSQKDVLSSLACYSNAGANDAKTMYNISSTANQLYGQYQQQLETIQFTEQQCENTTKLEYEVGTEKAYVNLQSCLQGDYVIPTSTSAPATATATTSAAPSSSVSTGAYSTSSVPISSSSTTTASTSSRPTILTTNQLVPVSTTPTPQTTSRTTVPVPLISTAGPAKSTTLPVPFTTTSAFHTDTPTTSAAPNTTPNLSSDLKKLLHSLLH